MTSSIDPTPRIRPVRYEPLTGALDTTGECPHCGGALPATMIASVAPTAPAVVEDLPDSDVLQGPVRRLLALVFEAVDGRRPVDQLAPVLSAPVLRYTRAARPPGCPARASRARSVRLCRPTEHAIEAAAVVEIDRRVRAVAARFDIEGGALRCVALRIL
jgi:hypothetical protein